MKKIMVITVSLLANTNHHHADKHHPTNTNTHPFFLPFPSLHSSTQPPSPCLPFRYQCGLRTELWQREPSCKCKGSVRASSHPTYPSHGPHQRLVRTSLFLGRGGGWARVEAYPLLPPPCLSLLHPAFPLLFLPAYLASLSSASCTPSSLLSLPLLQASLYQLYLPLVLSAPKDRMTWIAMRDECLYIPWAALLYLLLLLDMFFLLLLTPTCHYHLPLPLVHLLYQFPCLSTLLLNCTSLTLDTTVIPSSSSYTISSFSSFLLSISLSSYFSYFLIPFFLLMFFPLYFFLAVLLFICFLLFSSLHISFFNF